MSDLRFSIAILIVALFWGTACGHRNPRFNQGLCSIGSEAFNYPMDSWITSFRKLGNKKQDLPIHDGKGNGTAPKSLMDGTCDMAPMTRSMSAAETHALVRKYGAAPIAVPVAVEALNIIVPTRSPVRAISMENIKKLFHQGPPRLDQVIPISGPAGTSPPELFGLNSATDRFRWFRETALGGAPFSERVLETSGPLKLVDRVARSRAGFGYARPAESTAAVRALPILTKSGRVGPAGKTADYDRYPLARFYYIYLPPPGKHKSHPALKRFLRYVLSEDGQKALRPLGLYELSPRHRAKSLKLIQ